MPHVVTAVDALVPAERENDLVEGFARLNASGHPDGLIRSELLRGQEGRWRIQTTWRDRETIIALRQAGVKPAAIELLDNIGAEHSHGIFTIEQSHPS